MISNFIIKFSEFGFFWESKYFFYGKTNTCEEKPFTLIIFIIKINLSHQLKTKI